MSRISQNYETQKCSSFAGPYETTLSFYYIKIIFNLKKLNGTRGLGGGRVKKALNVLHIYIYFWIKMTHSGGKTVKWQ